MVALNTTSVLFIAGETYGEVPSKKVTLYHFLTQTSVEFPTVPYDGYFFHSCSATVIFEKSGNRYVIEPALLHSILYKKQNRLVFAYIESSDSELSALEWSSIYNSHGLFSYNLSHESYGYWRKITSFTGIRKYCK